MHWEKFIEQVPANDHHFLSSLQQEGVLSTWQTEEINHLIHKRDKAGKVYDILCSERDVDDFIILCELLQSFPEGTLRNLGNSLQLKAYELCKVK